MGRRAHGVLLAAPRASKGAPSSPPARFLVKAGGFPTWLGQRHGLQGSAISTEELTELGQSRRSARGKASNVLDSKTQAAALQRAPGHTWIHRCLHQHKPSLRVSSSSRTAALPLGKGQQSRPLRAAPSSLSRLLGSERF